MKAREFIRQRYHGHNLAVFAFIVFFVLGMMLGGWLQIWWPTFLLNSAATIWILYYIARFPVRCPFCNTQILHVNAGNYCSHCGCSLDKTVPGEK